MSEFLGYTLHKRPRPELLYGMSKSQYEAFMMQFHAHDRDRTGLLDLAELEQLCAAQGYPHGADALRDLYRAMDTDRGGGVFYTSTPPPLCLDNSRNSTIYRNNTSCCLHTGIACALYGPQKEMVHHENQGAHMLQMPS